MSVGKDYHDYRKDPLRPGGRSKGGWLAAFLILVLAALGAFAFLIMEQTKQAKQEKDELRTMILHLESYQHKYRTILSKVEEQNRTVEDTKAAMANHRAEFPEAFDLDAFVDDLKKSLTEKKLTVDSPQVLGEDVVDGVTETRVRVNIMGGRRELDLFWSERNKGSRFLDRFEVKDEKPDRLTVEYTLYSMPHDASNCANELEPCQPFQSQVWWPPLVKEVKKYEEMRMEYCIDADSVNQVNEQSCFNKHELARFKIYEPLLEKIEKHQEKNDERKMAVRKTSTQCDPAAAIDYDQELSTAYDAQWIIFCTNQGRDQALAALPGNVTMRVEKGQEMGHNRGRVVEIDNDQLVVEEIYIKAGTQEKFTIHVHLYSSPDQMKVTYTVEKP